MTTTIDVILFDLGGVLVELRPSPLPEDWLADGKTFDSIGWFNSQTALRFECGQISPEEFVEGLKRELDLQVNSSDILDQLVQWPVGLYPGARELLLELGKSCRLAALSNTNALHWPRLIHEFGLPRYFSEIFASHQIACAKPDPAAFLYVITALDVLPEKILFLDDNPANVAAAGQLGINGRQACSVSEVREKLYEFKLVAAP